MGNRTTPDFDAAHEDYERRASNMVSCGPALRHRSAVPLIEYRADVPDPVAFLRLFATTGWDPQGRLTAAAAAEALAHTWCGVSAYEGTRLVGTGRIIGDGVLHALIADVIVDPAYRHRGIGSAIVERLVAECRRQRIVDVQLFCARDIQPFYERLGFAARPGHAPGMELVEQR